MAVAVPRAVGEICGHERQLHDWVRALLQQEIPRRVDKSEVVLTRRWHDWAHVVIKQPVVADASQTELDSCSRIVCTPVRAQCE